MCIWYGYSFWFVIWVKINPKLLLLLMWFLRNLNGSWSTISYVLRMDRKNLLAPLLLYSPLWRSWRAFSGIYLRSVHRLEDLNPQDLPVGSVQSVSYWTLTNQEKNQFHPWYQSPVRTKSANRDGRERGTSFIVIAQTWPTAFNWKRQSEQNQQKYYLFNLLLLTMQYVTNQAFRLRGTLKSSMISVFHFWHKLMLQWQYPDYGKTTEFCDI